MEETLAKARAAYFVSGRRPHVLLHMHHAERGLQALESFMQIAKLLGVDLNVVG